MTTELEQQGERVRVLVVDNDPDNAETVTRLLDAWGYNARLSYTGSYALKVADEFQPQIFLLDLGMPDMNGFHLAATLREQDCFKKATLIALSGFADEAHRSHSATVGFEHFLAKPFAPGELKALLESIGNRTQPPEA
jgi:two-component system, sensor histidine kinase